MMVINTDFVFVIVFLPNYILIAIVDFFIVVIVNGIHMVIRYPHDPLLTISHAGIMNYSRDAQNNGNTNGIVI